MNYERARLVGNCVLGTIYALLPALIISILTERNGSFAVSFVAFAILFSILLNRMFRRARTQDKELVRQRYLEGKPPIGVEVDVDKPTD
jgi:hypothetical protein